jgi:hypothetical protein
MEYAICSLVFFAAASSLAHPTAQLHLNVLYAMPSIDLHHDDVFNYAQGQCRIYLCDVEHTELDYDNLQ